MKRLFPILILVLAFISCQKDEEVVTGADLFVGSYSGTVTTMLVANGEFLEYKEVQTTKTIEKGSGENDLILGKGTDMEFYASVDGNLFLIPGHIKHYIIEKSGVEVNFSVTGQGIWSADKKTLTITYGSYVKEDDLEYKLTIVESLHRN